MTARGYRSLKEVSEQLSISRFVLLWWQVTGNGPKLHRQGYWIPDLEEWERAARRGPR